MLLLLLSSTTTATAETFEELFDVVEAPPEVTKKLRGFVPGVSPRAYLDHLVSGGHARGLEQRFELEGVRPESAKKIRTFFRDAEGAVPGSFLAQLGQQIAAAAGAADKVEYAVGPPSGRAAYWTLSITGIKPWSTLDPIDGRAPDLMTVRVEKTEEGPLVTVNELAKVGLDPGGSGDRFVFARRKSTVKRRGKGHLQEVRLSSLGAGSSEEFVANIEIGAQYRLRMLHPVFGRQDLEFNPGYDFAFDPGYRVVSVTTKTPPKKIATAVGSFEQLFLRLPGGKATTLGALIEQNADALRAMGARRGKRARRSVDLLSTTKPLPREVPSPVGNFEQLFALFERNAALRALRTGRGNGSGRSVDLRERRQRRQRQKPSPRPGRD